MADDRKLGEGGARVRAADERPASDLGSRLREARQRRGMSLREIADVTRISVRVLDSLERNDISRLPGGIFTRAFVRAYAVEVGLDPETVVGDFVRQFPHESVTAGHPPSTRPYDESDDSERKIASTVVKLAAVTLPVAAIVIYFGMGARRSSEAPPQAAAPPAALTASSGALDRTEPASITASPAGRLTVELVASRSCALTATVDAQPPSQIRLEPGERRVFDVERELLLSVSDGAAVEWTINGAEGRPFGRSGERASVRLDSANYRDYLTAR